MKPFSNFIVPLFVVGYFTSVGNSDALGSTLNIGLMNSIQFDGDVHDSSGNNYNGILIGNTSFVADRFGNAGQALRTTNGMVYWGATYGNPAFSLDLVGKTTVAISIWVKANQEYNYPTDEARIILELGYSRFGIEGGTSGDGIKFFVNNSPMSSGTTMTVGEWTHYVLQTDGSKGSLYKNAQLVGEALFSEPITDTHASFRIAARDTSYFNGDFDDFRTYSRALTQQEISELYQIPEPSSLLLGGVTILGFGARRRR